MPRASSGDADDHPDATDEARETSGERDGDAVAALLGRARLEKFRGALRELGVDSLEDLRDVSTADLKELGFRKLEIERLRKALPEDLGGGAARALARSMLVKDPADLEAPLLAATPSNARRSIAEVYEQSCTQKKCCWCTRKQVLIALISALTSIAATVAGVLVKEHMDADALNRLCSQTRHEVHTKPGTAFCTSVPVGHSCPFECWYGFVKVGDLECKEVSSGGVNFSGGSCLCERGSYTFQHDTDEARCNLDTVSLKQAGFTADAKGLFAFTFAGSVPSDLGSGEVTVPATASLSLTGTGVETIGASFTVSGGTLGLTGFTLTAPSLTLSSGGFLSLSSTAVHSDLSIADGGSLTMRRQARGGRADASGGGLWRAGC